MINSVSNMDIQVVMSMGSQILRPTTQERPGMEMINVEVVHFEDVCGNGEMEDVVWVKVLKKGAE